MNGRYRLLLLLAALMASLGASPVALSADEAITVQNPSLSLTFRQGTTALLSVTDSLGTQAPAAGAGLQFTDGRTKKPLVATGKWIRVNGQWQFDGQLQDNPLSLPIRLTDNPGALTCAVELRNSGPQQGARKASAPPALIAVTLSLPFVQGETFSFFNGNSDTDRPAEHVIREGLGGMLPLAAWSNEKAGLAIGLDANEMHGWLHTALRPKNPSNGLAFSVRRVIDPGASERATFILFGFDGQWGTSAAVERYYDLFPSCFQVAPGTDPRIHFARGYVHGGSDTRPLQWEESRRLYHGWQPNWGFVRTGDWMPDEKHWFTNKGELRGYLDTVRELYSARAPGNLILHYLEVTQCEATLAEQEFPDSIV